MGRVDFNQEEHKEHTKVKEVLMSTQIIEQLVGMLEKYQNIVKTCFQGHVIFERSRQGAFETFLNKDAETQKDKMSMAEILSVYTDNILRKGGMKALAEVNKEEEHMKMIV